MSAPLRGIEPPDLISRVTDAVVDEVHTWQARPLDSVWPIVFLDALVIKVREIQSSGTPFFSEEILPSIDDNHAGLGGPRTLRGYQQDRFVGRPSS